MTRYTYATTLSWGGDTPTAELEVECSYTVAWGSPERGRFGRPEDYDPGAGDVVEDIKILTVDGRPWPVDLSYGFQTPAQDHDMLVDKLEGDHEADMIAEAVEAEVGRADDDADRRYREMREDWPLTRPATIIFTGLTLVFLGWMVMR